MRKAINIPWNRAIALLILATALTVFMRADTNPPKRRDVSAWENASAWEVKTEDTNVRMLRPGVLSVLLCLIDGEEEQYPAMMALIVVDESGMARTVTLPPQTRVLVDYLDADGNVEATDYATLADAYTGGLACGRAFENLLSSVSRLLCGAPIKACVAVSSFGLLSMLRRFGGVSVRYDYFNTGTNRSISGTDISNLSTEKNAEQALEYMRDGMAGKFANTGALIRQQEVFLGICERLRGMKEPYTIENLMEDTGQWAYSSITLQDASRLYSALSSLTHERAADGALTMLWAQEHIIDGVAYMLPNTNSIKTFVLESFYTENAKTEVSRYAR